MIQLTDFIELAEVRAVLGVSEYELSDETLSLPIYSRGVERTLRGISDGTNNLLSIFDTASASSDDDELYLADQTRQLVVYSTAAMCLSGLSLFAPKSTSDGKATETRFSSEATFKDVALNVNQAVTSITRELMEAIGADPTTMAQHTLMMRAEPSVDVVTGA